MRFLVLTASLGAGFFGGGFLGNVLPVPWGFFAAFLWGAGCGYVGFEIADALDS